jgi:hypothetical protein
MNVTKANKLPVDQYLHLLDVAAALRETYMFLSKGRCYRVYTEARKNGLRSKMCMGEVDLEIMEILGIIAKTFYPYLDITVQETSPEQRRPWSFNGVCIFVKVK